MSGFAATHDSRGSLTAEMRGHLTGLLSAAQVYHEAIKGSRLAILNHCGHRTEIKQADEFVRLVWRLLAET